MNGTDRFDTEILDLVDETHPGVRIGSLDRPIVVREYDDGSGHPPSELDSVTVGETIHVHDHATRVASTSRHGLDGELFQIGFYAEFCGTVCTLWVDRDPYLLDVCNSGIYAVDPGEIRVTSEAIT